MKTRSNAAAAASLMNRSSPPKMFLQKGVLKICSKFLGEHPCQSVISIKLLYQIY